MKLYAPKRNEAAREWRKLHNEEHEVTIMHRHSSHNITTSPILLNDVPVGRDSSVGIGID